MAANHENGPLKLKQSVSLGTGPEHADRVKVAMRALQQGGATWHLKMTRRNLFQRTNLAVWIVDRLLLGDGSLGSVLQGESVVIEV